MAYTDAELIFFNSLLDGQALFGLKVEPPLRVDKTYIENTISSLQAKGLIDKERRLVQTPENPALYLDLYKKATRHLVINNQRIALCGTKYAVVLVRTGSEYEIYGMSRQALLMQWIENTPLLRDRALAWAEGQKESFSETTLRERLRHMRPQDCTILQKYEHRKLVRDQILLTTKDSADLYDVGTSRYRKANGQTIRLLLLEWLELDLREAF